MYRQSNQQPTNRTPSQRPTNRTSSGPDQTMNVSKDRYKKMDVAQTAETDRQNAERSAKQTANKNKGFGAGFGQEFGRRASQLSPKSLGKKAAGAVYDAPGNIAKGAAGAAKGAVGLAGKGVNALKSGAGQYPSRELKPEGGQDHKGLKSGKDFR